MAVGSCWCHSDKEALDDPRGFLVRLGAPARAKTWSCHRSEASSQSVSHISASLFFLYCHYRAMFFFCFVFLHREQKFSHLVNVHSSLTVDERSLPPCSKAAQGSRESFM